MAFSSLASRELSAGSASSASEPTPPALPLVRTPHAHASSGVNRMSDSSTFCPLFELVIACLKPFLNLLVGFTGPDFNSVRFTLDTAFEPSLTSLKTTKPEFMDQTCPVSRVAQKKNSFRTGLEINRSSKSTIRGWSSTQSALPTYLL